MAPGLSGNDSNPSSARGGPPRSTGTVPKSKTRNENTIHPNSQLFYQQQIPVQQLHQISQQQAELVHLHQPQPQPTFTAAQQRTLYNNIPKNQILFEWHSTDANASPRKNSIARDSASDNYDSLSEGGFTQDNRFGAFLNSPLRDSYPQINGLADGHQALQPQRFRMNSQDLGFGASTSPSLPNGSSQRNSHGAGDVCRNAHVASEPTSRSLDGNNPNPADLKKMNKPSTPERAQVAARLSQIQEYIEQASSLLDNFRIASPGESNESRQKFLKQILDDLHDSEAKLQYLLSAFDTMVAEEKGQSCANSSMPRNSDFGLGESTSCFEQVQNGAGAMSSTQTGTHSKLPGPSKSNDLKVKLEESMKKLHSLQLEQAVLIQKRNQAQEQLQEAQREQNILMTMSSGRPDNQDDSDVDMEEQARNAVLNKIHGLEGRLCMIKSKNQVVNMDARQQSPSRERKLNDCQRKKLHMDFSSADIAASIKELSAEDEVKEQASSEDSAVEDALDEYAEARARVRLQGQIVRDKVAELNALRAQCEQVKTFISASQRDGMLISPDEGPRADHLPPEPAVNLQRQIRANDSVEVASDRPDSKQSNNSSKQQQLDQERAKLRRLQDLLATIQEYRSSGLPIPENLLNELGTEGQPCPTGSLHHASETEDAAVDADAEEEEEPESNMVWNQQRMALSESASMAGELSRGLQERAAQLQVERDGLASLQRQLDGLFSQLQQQEQQQPKEERAEGLSSSSSNATSTPSHQRLKDHNKNGDSAVQRRLQILSDIQFKWQLLHEDIASDSSLSSKAAPILSATRNVMSVVAAHVLPPSSSQNSEVGSESSEHLVWNQAPILDVGQASPIQGASNQYPSTIHHQEHYGEVQMSSAPPTLMRRRPLSTSSGNERAIWSSSVLEDESRSADKSTDPVRHDARPSDDNPPIISMPSPSPNVFQQHATVMQNRLAALSQSSQSLLSDAVDGMNPAAIIPSFPASIPVPPPPDTTSRDREMYYQQLLAAGQLQQQQVLLTAVNQCFHLLKLQQHELRNLSNTVHLISSGGAHAGIHPGADQWTGVVGAVGHDITSTPVPGAAGPPTLNNQVPPGNRTNNYWDNFRSYSRQNLLSTSAKSNEGLSHSPSPLVERSHNTLRGSTPSMSSTSAIGSIVPTIPQMSSGPTMTSVISQAIEMDEAGGGGGGGAAAPTSAASPLAAALGAVGPIGPIPPSGVDFAPSAPHMPSLSRKDKRNLDHHDGLGMPVRHPGSEIDHRLATRALEDAALPYVPQHFSTSTHDFEVPPMPILRDPAGGVHALINQINFSNSHAAASLDDSFGTSTRNQLNNEGVPLSEMSSTLSNQHFNEFGVFRSVDQTREGLRRLNIDFSNETAEGEIPPTVGNKRNTGAIKRTQTTPHVTTNNNTHFTPSNYQRNFHGSTMLSQSGCSNAVSNAEVPNWTPKMSGLFLSPSGDSEKIPRSSKHQIGQDISRNYNSSNRRPAPVEDPQPRSVTNAPSRSRARGMEDATSVFRRDVALEYEDAPVIRTLGFNNSHSSSSSQSSSGQNISNVEVHSFGSGKNQLKESCFQIRKCPKYQTKSGTRGQHSDTAVAAAAAVAAVAATNSTSLNVHRASKGQGGSRRHTPNKNNHDTPGLTQITTNGRLFEELRESVYAEMTSLISANESRPHFLIQLLKDLQHVSSDPLRQTALQLIQHAASRFQVEIGPVGLTDDELLVRGDGAEEDEDISMHHELKKDTQRQDVQHGDSPLVGACGGSEQKPSPSSAQEGDNLMQLVVGLELASVLTAHSEDVCDASVLEEIRRRVLQLVPLPSAGSNVQSNNSTRSSYFLYTQIESLLENILHKYQGCRVNDVSRELTSRVVNALPTRLMYLRMVDHYGRSNSNRHEPQETLEAGANGDLAEADQSHSSSHLTTEVTEDDVNHADCDGDSEADRDVAGERSVSASGSDSASGPLHVHVYQLGDEQELIDSEPEVEALQEEGEALSITNVNISGDEASVAAAGLSGIEGNITEEDHGSSNVNSCQQANSELWTSDQEHEKGFEGESGREEGLDRVPTRLASDNDRDQENGEQRSHQPAESL